jgi:hypothetical protein
LLCRSNSYSVTEEGPVIVLIFFLTEGRITRQLALILGQVVSKIKILTLFIGALDNDSPVEENESLHISMKFDL